MNNHKSMRKHFHAKKVYNKYLQQKVFAKPPWSLNQVYFKTPVIKEPNRFTDYEYRKKFFLGSYWFGIPNANWFEIPNANIV